MISLAYRWLPFHLCAGALMACLVVGCGRNLSVTTPEFPAGDVPNSHGLVSAGWLKQLLDYERAGGSLPRPAAYKADRFLILEANWTPPDKPAPYLTGHIPGAVRFNTDDLENGYPQWRLRGPNELQQAIGRAGISTNTAVIVYGRQLIAAARVWWVLKYSGVSDVRILDGGMEAWTSAGYPVETQARTPAPVEFQAPVATDLLATTEYVRQRLDQNDVWFGDVRSEAEFSGRVSGYSYLDAKGRIPGAMHLGDADDAAGLYCQRDGRLRPPPEILEHWRRGGLLPGSTGADFEREVIFYCGGGWRSSVACFYAWLLGMEHVRNYSDGWGGWSTNYHLDHAAAGSTPGWRQEAADNPRATDPL